MGLLRNRAGVWGLLAPGNRSAGPPRFVRARLYTYRLGNPAGRERDGVWWQRELVGAYGPELSRRVG